MENIIIGLVIVALVGIYMWLRNSIHREENLPAMSQPNLPAVSEDVNLPAVRDVNPPVNVPDSNQPPQQ